MITPRHAAGDLHIKQALRHAIAPSHFAQHHSKGGRPDQAILYYERAARIDAFAAPAKVKIAQVYVSQGRFNDALPLLRDAQSIRPREDVARYLEQVERASKSKR